MNDPASIPSPRAALVVGDVMLDYSVELADVPTSDEKRTVLTSSRAIGGTGANTAIALHLLGFPVQLAATVGDDASADFCMAELQKRGIDTKHCQRTHGATGRATIIHDAGARTVIVDRGVSDSPISHLPEAAITYVSSPGSVAKDSWPSGLIVLAAEHQMITENLAWMIERSSILLTNTAGFQSLRASGLLPAPIPVVETRGSAGTAIHLPAGQTELVTTQGVAPVDATGAGDAFAAGLCAVLAFGGDLKSAVQFGNSVAAAAVQTHGAALVELPFGLVRELDSFAAHATSAGAPDEQ